ncbi:hypothetical protein GCM10007094_00320 [Pseudovibrio japonicus]|uniref:Uncharacterized protein n=1 Tax=Pseudovibrio japonicus TaxID=366534 RepID=A0ABQ3DUK8_9HYPH|nr:hypothetical protein [Pseudovibrio japonicus]GHB16893.1 hypothetical protein GCM10007094_00320 [Pseudovibrio japonicus]
MRWRETFLAFQEDALWVPIFNVQHFTNRSVKLEGLDGKSGDPVYYDYVYLNEAN